MARDRNGGGTPPDTVVSIIGPGMTVVGDCTTDGTIRVEGRVEGSIRAGKAVVIGKEGEVEGDVTTQDAVVSGTIKGTLHAASRIEMQGTARVDGEVQAKRMQLEEGAVLNGAVHVGEAQMAAAAKKAVQDRPTQGKAPERPASPPEGEPAAEAPGPRT